MAIKKENLKYALHVLSKDNKVSSDVITTLSSLCSNEDNKTDEIDLIDRNAYIASTLWCRYDIAACLKGQNIEPTNKNIDAVLQFLNTDCLDDCEDGFCIINNAIETTEIAKKTAKAMANCNKDSGCNLCYCHTEDDCALNHLHEDYKRALHNLLKLYT